MDSHPFPHYEESLQRDIEKIRQKILEMSGLGEQALKNALQALISKNRQLAYAIILRDQNIDKLEMDLDRLCLEFIVRQQPVAGHLRFVYAATKITRDLERIGDYAESIARQVLLLESLEKIPLQPEFVELANLSVSMIHEATQIFLDRDEKKAVAVMDLEAQADDMRYNINAELIKLNQQGELPLEALTPLINVARRFERVTDQAKNICEEVLYVATGEIVKHRGKGTFDILFIDDYNSRYSQMAEGIAKSLGFSEFVFSSAGLETRPIDLQVLSFMKEKGIDIYQQFPKKLDQVPNLEFANIAILLTPKGKDVVLPGGSKTIRIEWKIGDFLKSRKEPQDARDYEKVYEYLANHIKDLLSAISGEEHAKKNQDE